MEEYAFPIPPLERASFHLRTLFHLPTLGIQAEPAFEARWLAKILHSVEVALREAVEFFALPSKTTWPNLAILPMSRFCPRNCRYRPHSHTPRQSAYQVFQRLEVQDSVPSRICHSDVRPSIRPIVREVCQV